MMEHDKMNVETVLAGPSVTSARVATSQKKRKKEERGNSLFSARLEKMAIKPGKDRKKSERQKNGEKLDGARSMMKTNFSQKKLKNTANRRRKVCF